MSTSAELEAKIKLLDWTGLRDLWTAIKAGQTPGWEPGEALEYLVIRAFELDGHENATVRYPYKVNLFDEPVEEIDGAVHLTGLSCLIESKDWEENVPIGVIAKMRSQLLRRPAATIGVVFAKRDFTEPAIVLAHFTMPQAILLWSGIELEKAITEEKITPFLRIKHRICVENGIPDYDIHQEIPT